MGRVQEGIYCRQLELDLGSLREDIKYAELGVVGTRELRGFYLDSSQPVAENGSLGVKSPPPALSRARDLPRT